MLNRLYLTILVVLLMGKGDLMAEGTYSLQVGEAGKERLEILNRVRNPYTLGALEELGVEGMTVLDVGCGTGILACELARLVGEQGTVVGIDNSEEQLEVAREEARKRGVNNIEFVQLSAHALDQLDRKFDLIMTRYVLVHLRDPERVIESALERLRPGGRLFLEEVAGIDCFVCHPPSDAYSQWAVAVEKQVQLSDTDFAIGYKLPALLEGLGCMLEKAAMYQPFLKGAENKRLLTLGVVEVGPKLIEAGLMDQEEMQSMIRDLTELESDDRYIPSCVRTAQVVARAPVR